MRSHGVPGFPDPDVSQGGVQIKISDNGSSDLNPRSPRFQAADQECWLLLPEGGKPVPARGAGPGSGSSTKVGTGG